MKNALMTKQKRKGFTLIELIIVIAIIAILAAVAIPKLSSVRATANESSDLATAKTIHSLIAAEQAANPTATAVPITPVDATTLAKLDGATKPKAGASGEVFQYSISADGNITVYVGTATKYPVK